MKIIEAIPLKSEHILEFVEELKKSQNDEFFVEIDEEKFEKTFSSKTMINLLTSKEIENSILKNNKLSKINILLLNEDVVLQCVAKDFLYVRNLKKLQKAVSTEQSEKIKKQTVTSSHTLSICSAKDKSQVEENIVNNLNSFEGNEKELIKWLNTTLNTILLKTYFDEQIFLKFDFNEWISLEDAIEKGIIEV